MKKKNYIWKKSVNPELKSVSGKSILVTGGTGSFGKSFVKFLLKKYSNNRIVIFSRDELKQFEMAEELNNSNLRFFIGDVRDYQRLKRAFNGIDFVIHAAALKQVVAAEYNPTECIKTNVYGAENVINAAIDCGVKRVIALSTDKAVNPVNLYGASKLCSDKLFISGNNLSGADGTIFSVVRYGNVIGSRGSVIPLFIKYKDRGEIPITDERMTRFWISLEDGVNFVYQSLKIMKGGEIFIPKIPSMKIVDLAKALAPNCKQVITGIRPGEKIHESMITIDDAPRTIEFEDKYIICPEKELVKEKEYIKYSNLLGKVVNEKFKYDSHANSNWFTVDQLRKILR